VSSLAWAIDGYLDLQGYWTDRIFVIEHTLAAARATADRWDEVALLGNLGLAYYALGQVEQARQYGQAALRIFEEIKSPTADKVRQLLASLPNEQ
jgi:hypothetical protein